MLTKHIGDMPQEHPPLVYICYEDDGNSSKRNIFTRKEFGRGDRCPRWSHEIRRSRVELRPWREHGRCWEEIHALGNQRTRSCLTPMQRQELHGLLRGGYGFIQGKELGKEVEHPAYWTQDTDTPKFKKKQGTLPNADTGKMHKSD